MAAYVRASRQLIINSVILPNLHRSPLLHTHQSLTLIKRRLLHTRKLISKWRTANQCPLKSVIGRNIETTSPVCSLIAIRYNSTGTGGEYIPPPPDIAGSSGSVVPDVNPEILTNALGEPTLQSLGLGGYTPPGIIQNILDSLHIYCPWWASIVIVTLIVRTLMFPIAIKARKNTVLMTKYMPEMTRLKNEYEDARYRNNTMDSLLCAQELDKLMKKNKFSRLSMMLVPVCQVPVFLSMYRGLTAMAEAPVASMTTGGLFWFTDLTVPDPYYILPILTSATLLLTLEIGSDGISTKTTGANLRWVLRFMPVVLLIFTTKFPVAMLCYWFSSNVFSLAQALVLKIPVVSDALNMPKSEPADKQHLLASSKLTLKERYKRAKDTVRSTNAIENRARVDAESFDKAGKGPIPKTYKYNPKLTQEA